MIRYAKVRPADGFVFGVGAQDILPPDRPGVLIVEIGADMAAESLWWDGSGIKQRIALNWAAIPADAKISTNGGAPTTGFVLPTAPGTWQLTAVGKYRGEKTITIQTIAEVQADLIADVKAEAERRKMLTASPGGYKKTEYAAKRAEVNAFDGLGGTVSTILAALALLPQSVRETRFAYASADAMAFGDTIQAAIARFRTGMTSSGSSAKIAAIEAKACAAIRAATTAPAKRAAFAAINWNA